MLINEKLNQGVRERKKFGIHWTEDGTNDVAVTNNVNDDNEDYNYAGFEVIAAVFMRHSTCLLGYNAVQSVEIQPMFRSNMSPPSSGPKTEPSLRGHDMLLRNTG
jgi:hypothetical protein